MCGVTSNYRLLFSMCSSSSSSSFDLNVEHGTLIFKYILHYLHFYAAHYSAHVDFFDNYVRRNSNGSKSRQRHNETSRISMCYGKKCTAQRARHTCDDVFVLRTMASNRTCGYRVNKERLLWKIQLLADRLESSSLDWNLCALVGWCAVTLARAQRGIRIERTSSIVTMSVRE